MSASRFSKMWPSTFAWLAAVVVTCPALVSGWSNSSTSTSPTCVTITETTGSTCPTISGFCPRPQCIELQTITLECGCPSIFSTTICPTACPKGCGTTYDTVYIPCATSLSSPPPVTTTPSTCYPSSSTSILSPPPISSPPIPNSTMTSTSTTIVTITSCPASVTCTGQKTTWTGTTGPSSCPSSSTCSCVLPGGPQTVLETTVTAPQTSLPVATTTLPETSPTPTATASGTSSPIQANDGSRYGLGVVEGGVLVGLIGAVLGML